MPWRLGVRRTPHPIDVPPILSPEADRFLSTLLDSVPPPGAEFSMAQWEFIAGHTDEFVRAVGDVFQAAHAYVAKWWKARNPTTMTLLAWKRLGMSPIAVCSPTPLTWPLSGFGLTAHRCRFDSGSRPKLV